MEASSVTAGASDATITVTVKFSGKSIPILISPDSTISDLKSLLLPPTNVLPRGQKLIFKGRVLEDYRTLTAYELSNGSNIMLVASLGLHQGTLYLSNNAVRSLPSKLFKACLQLSTLDLLNTKITIDIICKFDGWGDFDERRCSKHQKQLDFRVGFSRDFDEGADKK